MTESSENNMKLADDARDLFNKRAFAECIDCLDKLDNSTRSTQSNKIIARYSIDKDAKTCVNSLVKHSLDCSNDLTFNQHAIIDYNRSLILARQLSRFDESINLLEKRIKLINESTIGTSGDTTSIDQSVRIKIHVLLITIYMERKFRIKRALQLLDDLQASVTSEMLPKNFYYLKVRCYLANTDFVNFSKYMDKLTNNEQFMVNCYLESFSGAEQSICKLATFNSLNHVHLKNNEALTKFPSDKVLALYDLSKSFTSLTPEVLYNLALMHLNTGNIENALTIFESLIKDFKTNPRLWSRIADCHLIQFSQACQLSASKYGLESVRQFVGEHQDRKLIIRPSELVNRVNTPKDEARLRSANACLLNSLVLIKQKNTSFYPSNEPMTKELSKFKSSLLVKLAYVNLCLFDYVSANFYADLSLKDYTESEGTSSKGLFFIQTMLYKYESLIWLDRADEAEQIIRKLESKLEHEFAIEEEYFGYLHKNRTLGFVDWTRAWLKYVVFYDIASCMAIKQQIADLSRCLNVTKNEAKSTQEPLPLAHLILLSIYEFVVSTC